jgi:ATP-dependent HslUV protease subunit HslV
MDNNSWHGTTIALIRKDGDVVIAGDGQVSIGNTVMKSTAKKVRKIEKRNIIAGFAGSTADAFTTANSGCCRISKRLEIR